MGHNDRERRRLATQASVLRPYTERLFRSAGIGSGVRVLDLGCGAGDVSLLLSELVGAEGHVTGLDFDPGAIETATRRAAEAGSTNTEFIEANVAGFQPAVQFDAVAGRHILIHTPDAVAILGSAASLLRSGGILVFQEYDLSTWVPAWPANPANQRIMQLFIDIFRHMPHSNAGARLNSWFQSAGFAPPVLQGDVLLDGNPESVYFEWMAETLRTALTPGERLGIIKHGEIDPDQIARDLRAHVASEHSTAAGLIMIGAHSRKPS